MAVFDIRDFGATSHGGLADDAFDAVLATIDGLMVDDPTRGATVLLPSAQFVVSRSIRLTRNILLQGAGQDSTRLLVRTPAGSRPPSGIIVEKTPPNGHPQRLGDRSAIRDLSITSETRTIAGPAAMDDDYLDDLNGPGTSSGIVLYTKASVEHCTIVGFPHDGVHITTGAGGGRNANNWSVRDCLLQLNGRHGLFVQGGDANAGVAVNVESQSNGRWGFYDYSFLGSTYVGCMAEANHQRPDPNQEEAGAYRSVHGTSRTTFLNCYAEAGQISHITYPAMYIGGDHAGEIKATGLRVPLIIRNEGTVGAESVIARRGFEVTGRVVAAIASATPQDIDPQRDRSTTILVDASAGDLPMMLPDATEVEGSIYVLKRTDDSGYQATLNAVAGQRIDQATTVTLAPFDSLTLLAWGATWYVIGRS